MNMNIHFCGGHFAGVNLISLSDSDSCCATSCEMTEDDKGCCEDKEVQMSLDFDAQVITYEASSNKVYDATTGLVFSNEAIQSYRSQNLIPSDTGPPLKGATIRVLYQSFLC